MKTQKRLLSALLAVCVFLSLLPGHALAAGDEVPSPSQVYAAMIDLKDNDPKFAQGAPWTDEANEYRNWKGGPIDGKIIWATGCVAFAFEVSDIAFGSLPARKFSAGQFKYADVRVGDILRVNNDTHTVIVLQTGEDGLVLAEGNLSGRVHWGRAMSVAEFERDVTTYITRYPEGYVSPDDETADEEIDGGSFGGGLTWKLTKAGTLTVSGSGPMPDYDGPSASQPWNTYADKIRKIVIGDGVTKIGKAAFYGSQAITLRIADSVTEIGSSAFYGSLIVSVTIPGSVRTVGSDAFRGCPNLASVTALEGVEIIGERAFQGCINLTSADLPSTIKSLGAGAFYDCETLAFVTFAPDNNNTVEIGENLFARCWVLRPVTLPERIDRISKEMFQNCYMMFTGIEIPQGVKIIGDSAFASCGAMSVVIIPDSVTDIETAAFQQTGLTDIYYKGTQAQWKAIWKSNSSGLPGDVNIHYHYTDGGDVTPTATPTAAPVPTSAPTATPAPSATPGPAGGPSKTPSPTGAPTAAPTPAPTNTPVPMPAPDNSPSPSPGTDDTVATVTLPGGGKATTIKSADGGIKIITENAQGKTTANISIPGDPGPAKAFSDVHSGDWYKSAVDAVTSLGLFSGTSAVNFSPNTAMTRGMIVTVLYQLSGKVDYGVGSGAFDDVASGAWYTDAVEWARAANVAAGIGNNRFDPNGSVTREQLVTMLYRYAELIGKDSGNRKDISSFPDSGQVSSYAQDAVSWAVAEGFVQGRGRYLAPRGNATRAEAATILNQFVSYLKR